MNETDKREVEVALANLRHAYMMLMNDHVKDTKRLADGLIHPSIARIERVIARDRKSENPESFGNWWC